MLGLTPEEIAAVEALQASPPYTASQVVPQHSATLAVLYAAIHKNPSTKEYKFLCQVRDGKITLDDGNLYGSWLPAFWNLMGRYDTTKEMRGAMRRAVNNLPASGIETIYRDCSADEATSAQISGKLEQSAEHSFDKYKWLFVDLSKPPVQSKDPPFRLTITVKSGVLKLLDDLSVQHVGGVDSPVVTRCYARLKAKSTTVDEGVPNEPGSYAVHQDVLDIFCPAITRITKNEKK